MKKADGHYFYIPVMGISFTIDTPLKVAKYGISSVIPIADDILIEDMRKYYSEQNQIEFEPLKVVEGSGREKRITAYLNLVKQLVDRQVEELRKSPFEPSSEITRYFYLLPDKSELKQKYLRMLMEEDLERKLALQKELRAAVEPGSIDVNIMTKVDAFNYDKNGEINTPENSIALASLRGFANSNLNSSVVFSAGMNPRLYGYIENFRDFFPGPENEPKKKIILKVSDFRSALIQGKFLAKKGLWISEFRIESGLNCGGHAFATDGFLMGPILQEFHDRRQMLRDELFQLYSKALLEKGIVINDIPETKIGVQGGIGTAKESEFLIKHYGVNATGWGTPFLLVPEATTVDNDTLMKLAGAGKEDLYLSDVSPLGVRFNNLKGNTKDAEKLERINKGIPGAPCKKEYLISNTEFTKTPICTASRQYQKLKIDQLNGQGLDEEKYKTAFEKIVEKVCLCEGLASAAVQKYNLKKSSAVKGVSVCPGPNLAYFSGVFTLEQMVKHIYGRINILNNTYRPNVFINELAMYVDYLKKEIIKASGEITAKQENYFENFNKNLKEGIEYYKNLIPKMIEETKGYKAQMMQELTNFENELMSLLFVVKTVGIN